MKQLYWVGASQDDVREFPEAIRRAAGFELHRVQSGLDPSDWKPMPGVGKGVREIRLRGADGAFRVFYVVWDADSVYVLHAFQKKTQKTPPADIEKGQARYGLIPRK
jgi:phage-related protein